MVLTRPRIKRNEREDCAPAKEGAVSTRDAQARTDDGCTVADGCHRTGSHKRLLVLCVEEPSDVLKFEAGASPGPFFEPTIPLQSRVRPQEARQESRWPSLPESVVVGVLVRLGVSAMASSIWGFAATTEKPRQSRTDASPPRWGRRTNLVQSGGGAGRCNSGSRGPCGSMPIVAGRCGKSGSGARWGSERLRPRRIGRRSWVRSVLRRHRGLPPSSWRRPPSLGFPMHQRAWPRRRPPHSRRGRRATPGRSNRLRPSTRAVAPQSIRFRVPESEPRLGRPRDPPERR